MLVVFTLVYQANLEWQRVNRIALLLEHLSSIICCL